jgi:hypothetical protein
VEIYANKTTELMVLIIAIQYARLNRMLISSLQSISQRMLAAKFYPHLGSSIISILIASQSLALPESDRLSLCPSDLELKTVTPNQQPHSYLRFAEGAWDIAISREYRGKCKLSIGERLQKVNGSWIESNAGPIDLAGATFGGTKIRHTYTWEKEGRKYLAIWQPTDERFIRFQIVKSNGQLEANVLLPQVDR